MIRLINPFESAACAAAGISGVVGLFTGAPEGSVLALTWPGWAGIAYYVFLTLGSVLWACGMLRAFQTGGRGIRVWRAGLLAVGGTWGSYGLAILILSPPSVGGVILLLIGIAAGVRQEQLRHLEK